MLKFNQLSGISEQLKIKGMADFKYNGFTYEKIVKPFRGGVKYEFIKWVNGYRNFWERITLEEYKKAKRYGH